MTYSPNKHCPYTPPGVVTNIKKKLLKLYDPSLHHSKVVSISKYNEMKFLMNLYHLLTFHISQYEFTIVLFMTLNTEMD